MDTLAEELGLDPIEFRLKNLLLDNCALPTGQVLETITVSECVRRAVELSGWRDEVNQSAELGWESEVKAL
jgi:CO/xanthine dehydrogenase Mo-binding subunit